MAQRAPVTDRNYRQPSDMAECGERFLVIRLSSIGDIVHTLPAVAALGGTFPGTEIHWAVEARHAVLLEGNPSVHRVIELDTLGWRNHPASLAAIEKLIRGYFKLRKVAYEATLDFQGLFKSALIARLSRSPRRIGFTDDSLRELAAGVFYTERVAPRGRHVIEKNLALVERMGAHADKWEFPLPHSASDERYVEEQLAQFGARDFVIMSPGGGWTGKRWPPEYYAGLIRRLAAEFPGTVFLTGSLDEEELIRGILERALSEKAFYFRATITQWIALARRARLFVGGDSGPLHLAAALATPIVAIYGAKDPLNSADRNGPFSREDVVLIDRTPAGADAWRRNSNYLSGVSAEEVLAGIRRRLAQSDG